MDVGKSFTFIPEDESWIKKIAIGGVVTIIPIVNFIAAGYGLRVLRNVAEGRERPLPEWDDWGGDFMKGLLVAIASLIYALPAIILSGIGSLIVAMVGNTSGDVEGAAGLLTCGTSCLSTGWSIAVGIWMPAAVIRFVAKNYDFGAFFDFAAIWNLIVSNVGAYATAILVTIIASLAGALGAIACIIGIIFTMFYAQLVSMHIMGQFANEAGAIVGGSAGVMPSYPELDEFPPAEEPLDEGDPTPQI